MLAVDKKQCVHPDAIRNRLRREPDSLDPSNPSNPQRSYTFTYRFDWGDLRFGFDAASDCLFRVAIDQIEGAAKNK